MSDFKDILKKLRKSKNMTQDDLANKLGVSRSTISCYENGTRTPTSEGYEEIADFFNVDINFLFGKLEIMRPVLYDEFGTEYSVQYHIKDDPDAQKNRLIHYSRLFDTLVSEDVAKYSKEIATLMYENEDYKLLFDECKKLKSDDIKLAYELIKRISASN